jgi:orotidine-5'-phosphate decarboxylase
MACKFFEMLKKRWEKGARVCVGLDSDPTKLPAPHKHPTGFGSVDLFNFDIVNQTADRALAYKPNIAFYSGRFSPDSLSALRRTIDYVRRYAPDVPIILDSKRADIGNTNAGYVEEAFTSFDADAITVNPYFGMIAMKPFLDQKDKGIIVLCRTSNPGAGEFQDLMVDTTGDNFGEVDYRYGRRCGRTAPLYQIVARNVAAKWNYNGNCALVVGATYPDELKKVREIVDDMWILVPGVGTQGGDVNAVIEKGLSSNNDGLIINSSSGVIFSKNPRDETIGLTASINRAINSRMEAHAP